MSDAFGRQGFKEVKSGLGGLFSAGGGDEEENLVYQRVPQGGKAAAAKPVRPLAAPVSWASLLALAAALVSG